mmetsp:Transcript_5682/g.16076  ORF Transcript_5682/g.16076 Transcript_5682/m.16076 type:complete len:314 (-) Transcript_5682:361-1302(-)
MCGHLRRDLLRGRLGQAEAQAGAGAFAFAPSLVGGAEGGRRLQLREEAMYRGLQAGPGSGHSVRRGELRLLSRGVARRRCGLWAVGGAEQFPNVLVFRGRGALLIHVDDCVAVVVLVVRIGRVALLGLAPAKRLARQLHETRRLKWRLAIGHRHELLQGGDRRIDQVLLARRRGRLRERLPGFTRASTADRRSEGADAGIAARPRFAPLGQLRLRCLELRQRRHEHGKLATEGSERLLLVRFQGDEDAHTVARRRGDELGREGPVLRPQRPDLRQGMLNQRDVGLNLLGHALGLLDCGVVLLLLPAQGLQFAP